MQAESRARTLGRIFVFCKSSMQARFCAVFIPFCQYIWNKQNPGAACCLPSQKAEYKRQRIGSL